MQGEAHELPEADFAEPGPEGPAGPTIDAGPRRVDLKELADRLMLAEADSRAHAQRLSESRRRLTELQARWQTQRTLREASHESAYARLLARFQSQPIIEQAKGVLMAESHCSADQAFEILRKASQRENVPVREIAARIVRRAAPPAKP